MISRTLRRITTTIAITAAVAAAAFAVLPVAAQAQEAAPAAAVAEKGKAPEGETLWGKISHVNPVVTFCLFAGSVLMIWFGVDGVIKTTRARAIPKAQVEQLRELFKQGDYVSAYTYSKANLSPLCDVVRTGISFLPDGKVMTEEAMFGEIARINGTLMGRVSYLSVIGVCSPMVGLCGTVFGMMNAFNELGKAGAGSSELSSAIGEVLVATAMGLLLAIPAFVLYYVLRNRITVILHDVQEAVAGLFRQMPYEAFNGYHLGDDEIYAQPPNWVGQDATLPNQAA
ncbi:MAG: MotA/TolQ/ExbB proton channel family protein [Puniceicoccales bacterium]|jgi:biopolymer transport protein ExbB|nr:MotA/TolQ/ExbB proton channel family protein [Puniceicoccales bacterium]